MTVQAFGSLIPFTMAVFSWPAPITWHVGEVQFTVSPQPFCALANAHNAEQEINARISFDFIVFTAHRGVANKTTPVRSLQKTTLSFATMQCAGSQHTLRTNSGSEANLHAAVLNSLDDRGLLDPDIQSPGRATDSIRMNAASSATLSTILGSCPTALGPPSSIAARRTLASAMSFSFFLRHNYNSATISSSSRPRFWSWRAIAELRVANNSRFEFNRKTGFGAGEKHTGQRSSTSHEDRVLGT